MLKLFSRYVFGLVLILLFSCKGKNEIVPAYIHIDSLSIAISGSSQGNNIHKLNAVGFYVDDLFLGIFELPATIPAQFTGKHRIKIIPHINLNGTVNRFSPYIPAAITDTSAMFEAGKITNISNIKVQFRNNVNFKWVEDFEDNNASIYTYNNQIPPDDTSFISTDLFDLNGRYSGNSKMLNVLLHACDTLKYFAIAHFDNIELPNDNTDVFFEFDIKSSIPVQLSLLRTKPSSGTEFVTYLYVNSTDNKWKRIYTNFIYETAAQPAGTKYKIVFDGFKPASKGDETLLQFDNFRLTYLN